MLTVRKIVILLVILLVCTCWLIRSNYPIPELSQLSKVTGPATVRKGKNWSEKRKHIKTILSIQNYAENKIEEFEILNWYPSATSLHSLIRSDRPTTVWKDSMGYPWQIEQDGNYVVSHASMCTAVKAQHKLGLYMVIVFSVLGPVVLVAWPSRLDRNERPVVSDNGTSSCG